MPNQNDVIVTVKLAGKQQFKQDVSESSASVKQMATVAKMQAAGTQKAWGQVGDVFKDIGKIALTAGAVGVGALVAISANGIKVASDLESARMGFVTLLGSAQKADAIIKTIKRDAATTPFEINGLVQANLMLTSVTKDGPRSERLLLNVGKALAAMGKGQPEMDRIIVNLQQIGSLGHASMLDIKQFAFAGIPIFDMLKKTVGKTTTSITNNGKAIAKNKNEVVALQKKLQVAQIQQSEFTSKTKDSTRVMKANQIAGYQAKIASLTGSIGSLTTKNGTLVKSQGDLDKAIKDGKITFKMLEDMFNAAGEGDGQFSKAFTNQATTMTQVISNLKDSWNLFTADFVINTGIFDTVKEAIGRVTDFMSKNKDKIAEWEKKAGEAAKGGVGKLLTVAGGLFDALSKISAQDWDTIGKIALMIGAIGAAVLIATNPIAQLAAATALVGAAIFGVVKAMEALDKATNTRGGARASTPADFKKAARNVSTSPLQPIQVPGAPRREPTRSILKSPLQKKAGGGIIGGMSSYGDQTLARVNSGEMILNKGQQSVLFALLKRMSSSNNINFNAPINFGGQSGQMQKENQFTNLLKNLAL